MKSHTVFKTRCSDFEPLVTSLTRLMNIFQKPDTKLRNFDRRTSQRTAGNCVNMWKRGII